MELTIDTETSGFRENRLVQLSFELSHESRIIHEATLLIRPDGWEIEEGATAVHGITQEHATKHGIPLRFALNLLGEVIFLSEIIVAHNAAFDLDRVLIPEYSGGNKLFSCQEERLLSRDRARFCTMVEMTPICQIPGKFDKFKWPKLSEAYQHAFGEELQGAHRADVDRKACARLYRWLRDREIGDILESAKSTNLNPDTTP